MALSSAGLAGFAALTRSRVEKLVPPDGQFAVVNGKTVHYLERGSGPPLVMIHGLAGQMRHFSYALLDILAKDYRVILIDRPGSGYSEAIGAANIRAQAAHIGDFLAALGVGKATIVGHSLGGAVALALALDRPELVERLALLAPLTHPQDDASGVFRGLAIPSAAARFAIAWTVATPMMMMTGAEGAREAFAPEPVPDDFAIRGGGALLSRPGNFRAASADFMAVNDDLPDMVGRYPDLRVPVAVLYGRGDRLLDPQIQGRQFADAVAQAELTLIDGGHMIPITQPEVVADWIRRSG